MQSPIYAFHRLIAVAISSFFLGFSTVTLAQEHQIKHIVTFGTSLSDSGNAFVLLSDPVAFGFEGCSNMGTPINVPPYDTLDEFLIPDGAYAKGGHHVSNGATWVELLARGRGLSGETRPALGNESLQARNYAVGGARSADFPCRFNLRNQLDAYQSDFPATSAETLIIIEMGGNDVRDALVAQDPAVLVAAITHIAQGIEELYQHGARKFLLVNVPAVGETPAVKILDHLFPGIAVAANAMTDAFNANLANLLALNGILPEIDLRILDLHTLLNDIIADPASFGIINTVNACITPNVPPFHCKNPDAYLFWDGVHPTKAVHSFMAQQAIETVLAP